MSSPISLSNGLAGIVGKASDGISRSSSSNLSGDKAFSFTDINESTLASEVITPYSNLEANADLDYLVDSILSHIGTNL